jgi:hypothetical protein
MDLFSDKYVVLLSQYITNEVKWNGMFLAWMYVKDLVIDVKVDLRGCTIH